MNTAIQFFGSTLFKLDLIPEYIAVLDYADSQGMVLPSDRKKQKDSNRLKKLIEDDIWDELDILYLFDQEAGRSAFATLNFKDPEVFRVYNDPLVFPDFVPGSGFYSSGNKFLKTGFHPQTHAKKMQYYSCSIIFKLFSWPIADFGGGIAGSRTGNNLEQIFISNSALSNIHLRLFHSLTGNTWNQNGMEYSIITSRISSSEQLSWGNGTIPIVTRVATTSGPMTDQELYLLGINENGTLINPSTGGMKYFGAGGNLNHKAEQIYNILSN